MHLPCNAVTLNHKWSSYAYRAAFVMVSVSISYVVEPVVDSTPVYLGLCGWCNVYDSSAETEMEGVMASNCIGPGQGGIDIVIESGWPEKKKAAKFGQSLKFYIFNRKISLRSK